MYHFTMTSLLALPLTRSIELGRRATHNATRISASLVGPVTRPLTSIAGSAGTMVRHIPGFARAATARFDARVPEVVARRLPARAGEVAALEARIMKLETQAAAPTPRAKAAGSRATASRPRSAR